MRRTLKFTLVALLMISLVSCASSPKGSNNFGIKSDERESMQYSMRRNLIGSGFDSNGFYTYSQMDSTFQGALGELHFYPFDNTQSKVISSGGNNKIGLKPLVTGIVSNGDWLYFMDMSYNSQVVRISKKDGSKEVLFDSEKQNSGFVIMDGELIAYSNIWEENPDQITKTEFTRVHKDTNMNEVFSANVNVQNPIPFEGKLYFSNLDEDGKSMIYTLDMKTEEIRELFGGYVDSIDGGYMTSFELDVDSYDNINYETLTTIAKLYDLKENKVLFTKEDEAIGFVDAEQRLVYSSKIRGEQIYRLYDFEGNVISEIKPRDFFESEALSDHEFVNLFGERDFGDYIVANNKEFLAPVGYYNFQVMKCSFDTGECKLIP